MHCAIKYSLLNAINPYHWITWTRNRSFDKGVLVSRSFDLPVICIGNITVGGTGKTPHTEYLIRLLKDKYRLAVLSRGYGRKSSGYILADEKVTMQRLGDEPYQMHCKFPDVTVAVDENRVHGILALLSRKKEPDVILLDDAYQHRYVEAGMNILLIDYNRPIWRDAVLPYGRMRESIQGAERADIIIITKSPRELESSEQMQIKERLAAIKEVPVFFSAMRYGEHYPLFPSYAAPGVPVGKGSNVLLVTGIAKPAPLKAELERRGANVRLMQYADHHNFSAAELDGIAAALASMGSGGIMVTTEKDAARLASYCTLPEIIKNKAYVMPIEVEILNNEEYLLNKKISDYVTENSRDSIVP